MIDLPAPELQIDFSRSLKTIRTHLLQQALLSTVRNASLQQIDSQLREYVSEEDLKRLAAHGLRGELLFQSPSTNRFYRISELKKGSDEEFSDFRSRVLSLVGIPG